jgi:hypothetical protein
MNGCRERNEVEAGVYHNLCLAPDRAGKASFAVGAQIIIICLGVMEEWPLPEFKLIHPQPDPDSLKKFTYVENEITQ